MITDVSNDKKEIYRSLKALTGEGQVIEVRAFQYPKSNKYKVKTVSGYFDDMKAATRAISTLNEKVTVYMTLNPVMPELLPRAANRLEENPKATTSDKYISRRFWLPIDTDPNRPSNISASDKELKKAIKRRNKIAKWLKKHFNVQPTITAMSGNGGHLLYAVNLENDDVSEKAIRDLLVALHDKFGDGDGKDRDPKGVSIDRTVFNASRIWKVYGTVARKGDNVSARPHRIACIEEHSPDGDILTLELIETITRKIKGKTKRTSSPLQKYAVTDLYNNGNEPMTVEKIIGALDKHEIGFEMKEKGDSQIFMLDRCLNTNEHDDGAAIILQDGKPGYKCHHDTCYGVGMSGKIYDFLFRDEPTEETEDKDVIDIHTGEIVDSDDYPFVEGFTYAGAKRPFIQLSLVQRALDNNHRGDSDLFRKAMSDHLIRDGGFKSAVKGWYNWTGQYWAEFAPILNTFSVQTGRQYRQAMRTWREIYNTHQGEIDNLHPEEDAEQIKAIKQELKRIQGIIDAFKKRKFANQSPSRTEGGLKYSAELMSIDGGEWDQHPLLLGTSNGVIDLEKGLFRNGQPSDLMRHILPIEFDPEATAPRWQKFISEIMGGDEEMVGFLQRLLGYSTTGLVKEHIFPIFWGENGRNGKGVLFNTLQKVLGDLAGAGTHDLIKVARQGSSDAASPSKMILQGRRIVYVEEPNANMRLDNGQIKQLTGGGAITARHLHQNLVTFDPTHTLFLICNPKPFVLADDPAMWIRLKMIPFVHRFIANPDPENPLEHKADLNLEDKLSKELPGILNWLIEGYYQWREHGLGEPEMVVAATSKYKYENDRIAQFISECFVIDKKAKVKNWLTRKETYNIYCDWMFDSGYSKSKLGAISFHEKMQKHIILQTTKGRVNRYRYLIEKASNDPQKAKERSF